MLSLALKLFLLTTLTQVIADLTNTTTLGARIGKEVKSTCEPFKSAFRICNGITKKTPRFKELLQKEFVVKLIPGYPDHNAYADACIKEKVPLPLKDLCKTRSRTKKLIKCYEDAIYEATPEKFKKAVGDIQSYFKLCIVKIYNKHEDWASGSFQPEFEED